MESTSSDETFMAIVDALVDSRDVTFGENPRRGFGSSALQVNGKIFAMIVRKQLVVKLPKPRVASLIASGDGEPFDPGHGRLMKQWLSVHPDSGEDWLSIATEARDFVASLN